MSFLYAKNKQRTLIMIRVSMFLLGLFIIFLAMSVYERWSVERDMATRRSDAEQELEALKERKAVLEDKVKYLSNNEGVEAEIRKNFDVAREGEQVVVLVDDKKDEPEILPLPEPEPEEASFWSRFWPW